MKREQEIAQEEAEKVNLKRLAPGPSRCWLIQQFVDLTCVRKPVDDQ